MNPGDKREEFFREADGINHKIIETHMRINKNHRMLLERNLNRNGMYRGQHQILMCIFRNPDVSQKDLAKLHNVSTATIAVSLKKLEKGGYVKRMADSEDNRFNKVMITEKGYHVVENSVDFFRNVETGLLEGFDENDKDILYAYLQRISRNLEKMLQKT